MLALSCEHASCAVPPDIELGVSRSILRSHVGWDHGAAETAKRLGESFDVAPALGVWTRLYVDLNRRAENPAVIPHHAFGAEVPGNYNLVVEERATRLQHHAAWRRGVQDTIRQQVDRHGRCLHLSIHSFTNELQGKVRDFDLGVLFDPNRAYEATIADEWVDRANRMGIATRANEPYTGWGEGLTTATRNLHPEQEYLGFEIEISHRVTRSKRRLADLTHALVSLITPTLSAAPTRVAMRTPIL
jgi:predicted N-formylglutamate amidohydrolase